MAAISANHNVTLGAGQQACCSELVAACWTLVPVVRYARLLQQIVTFTWKSYHPYMLESMSTQVVKGWCTYQVAAC